MLDTNGNGKRDPYTEGEQRVVTAPSGESLGTSSALNSQGDATKDTRLNAAFYGLAVGPDGMVWGSVLGFPGGIVRLNPGSNPPETALAEYYEVPYNNPKTNCFRFFATRDGCRWQRRRLGCRWAAAISPASIAASARAL